MTSDTPATTEPAGQNDSSNGIANGTPRTKICVYCGASGSANPAHTEAAQELARVMAENDIDLGKSPWQRLTTFPWPCG